VVSEYQTNKYEVNVGEQTYCQVSELCFVIYGRVKYNLS